MALEIRKKTSSVWEHIHEGRSLILSAGHFRITNGFFELTEPNGVDQFSTRKVPIGEVEIYDDTAGGVLEAAFSPLSLTTRLKTLEYPYFKTATGSSVAGPSSWGDITGNINNQTDLINLINSGGTDSTGSKFNGNFFNQPGTYDYFVWQQDSLINGTAFPDYDSDTVTVNDGDATNDRFDVIVYNADLTFSVVEGTPSLNPSIPIIDTDTQVAATIVFVEASSTQPSDVDTEIIYDENAQVVGDEWDTAVSGATVIADNTDIAESGTTSIKFNGAGNNDSITLTDSVTHDEFGILKFNVYITTDQNHKFLVTLGASSVTVEDGNFGFSRTTINSWQTITIDSSQLNPGLGYDTLEIRNQRNGITAYIDDIFVQKGVILTNTPHPEYTFSYLDPTYSVFKDGVLIFQTDILGGGGSIFEPNTWRPELLDTNTAAQNATLVNDAITAAKVVNGVVLIPAGDFDSTKWNWDPRVRLYGAGKNATKINFTQAEAMIEYTGDTWYFPTAIIEGMHLRGGVDENNRVSTIGLNIKAVTYFHFRDLMFQFIDGNSIEMEGCLIGKFENVQTHRCVGGVKSITAQTTSIGRLQDNLVLFDDCQFQWPSTWAVQWDNGSSIQFHACDFEQCGTDGDVNTGIMNITDASPGGEGTGIVLNGCWGEFNYGTLFKIQGNQAAKHSIRDSMFQYGTTTKAVNLNGGQLLIDNSTLSFGVDIVNGYLETRNATIGTVTLQNASTHRIDKGRNLTGTTINLGSVVGYTYNFGAANNGTVYTPINIVEGGFAVCLINAPSAPSVTGATQLPAATFVADTDMEMVVEVKNGTVRYFFLEL